MLATSAEDTGSASGTLVDGAHALDERVREPDDVGRDDADPRRAVVEDRRHGLQVAELELRHSAALVGVGDDAADLAAHHDVALGDDVADGGQG